MRGLFRLAYADTLAGNCPLSVTSQPEYLLHSSRAAAPHEAAEPDQRAGASTARVQPGGLPGWWSLGTAIVAGLALAAAFPPLGLWPMAMAGPALLTLAVREKNWRAALGLGLSCGTVFFVALLSWLVNVAWYAWIALTVTEALIFGVLTIALVPLLRLRAWPLAVAGWWVAQELVRGTFPWGGFPWGRLAMSQAGAPTAGWAAIGGPPLLSFLLALAGATIAYLVVAVTGTRRRDRGADDGQIAAPRFGSRLRQLSPAIAACVIVAGLVLTGDLAWQPAFRNDPTAVVATVQGDVPHARNLPNLLRASTVTANHAAATVALAGQVRAGRRPAPSVVIWPENSTDIDPSLSPSTYHAIATAVDAIGRPVLVGAVLDNPLRNAGQLWLPGRGPVGNYIKRQLVPFGEVIPLRGLLDNVTSLPSLQPVNFTPGHRAVVFGIGKVRLGDVICYEVGYDNLVRSEVLAGANLLTVQTNDADYELDGQVGETEQQLAMARMDAIWTGRSVAVASTTGISAIIAPDGTVLTQSRIWQRAELEARVPLVSALTPADRAGNWPELAITGLTGLALAWSLARAWRRRSLPERA
ncbi:MAG TPA: apolipoprotein N-acyltransferase [Streptosporangiaceae bacterium]